MVKKLKKPAAAAPKAATNPNIAATVKESAQQIWLAGLGAFSKAQDEGNKVFEALVKEGLSLQRKTQSVAEDKISEATSRVADMANGISSRAAGQWDKLESIFEERVAKALQKLGIPAATDLASLAARLEVIEKQLGIGAKPAAKKAAPKKVEAEVEAPAAKPATKAAPKAAAKPAAKPAVKAASPAKAPARKAAAPKAAATDTPPATTTEAPAATAE